MKYHETLLQELEMLSVAWLKHVEAHLFRGFVWKSGVWKNVDFALTLEIHTHKYISNGLSGCSNQYLTSMFQGAHETHEHINQPILRISIRRKSRKQIQKIRNDRPEPFKIPSSEILYPKVQLLIFTFSHERMPNRYTTISDRPVHLQTIFNGGHDSPIGPAFWF